MAKPRHQDDLFHRNVHELTKREVVAHCGDGTIRFVRPFAGADFDTDMHFIDYVEIPPQASIGRHTHGENEEIYFIVAGRGEMTVNNRQIAVSAGDLIVNRRGWSHGLINDCEDDLKVLVWEIGYSG
jgi:mannose-6-phosphate isomerase-like protein (cupin superfamily)